MSSAAPSNTDWMARALSLARRGEALASPNPLVGAVLVRDREIVGEGFHTYDGVRHAEIIALEQAREAARGSTLYINLEPCCHQGRTGPCTLALISSGVAAVVAAMRDPNPAVAGSGFRQLRAAGIKVEFAPEFESEARRLNEAFAAWITSRRPLVTLKTAMTLDGCVILPPMPKGKQQRWITSDLARAEVQRMRHASDALLTGIGTVLIDDPLLTDRTGLPRRRPLLRVVLDSRLRLSPRSRLVRSADSDVLVFTSVSDSAPQARALRRAGVEIISLQAKTTGRHQIRRRPYSHVDLAQVLAELARRDILSVLLEAGPILNQTALGLGLVDKVRLFYAPMLIGNLARHAQSDTLASSPKLPHQFHTISAVRIEQFGPDFAVEGYLRDIYA